MKRETAWKKYEDDCGPVERAAAGYIDFISDNKTERECAASAIAHAKAAGYRPLSELIEAGVSLKPGDKVWACNRGKAVILAHIGSEPLTSGANILGAHIDSPRLDLKQNPLYEDKGLVFLDTHYYGGVKNYQWVALPLALHGVVAKKDGSVVNVVIGEDPADPVFCVTDLLPHLGRAQLEKKASEVVEGEHLDILAGNRPASASNGEASSTGDAPADAASADSAASSAPSENTSSDAASKARDGKDAEKEAVKARLLEVLAERYGIEEEDFLSAEIEVVPAGRARELGFDRGMILGYGQDDRVCSYTSLIAQLALGDEVPKRTAVCVLVDKEEIGSVGATGMESNFFENTMAEILALAGEDGTLALRRALKASRMLSSDVSAGFDPTYANVFEEKNAAFLGRGLVFNKYMGSRGKSGSNDASAEYVAFLRRVMDDAGVSFQTAELGRVDAGGGGTIAFIPARYGMDVIDSGVAVLSMHSPWEVTSKVDVYEAYRGYEAFLRAE